MLAFLRGADVRRLIENGLAHLVNTGASNNHWSKRILDQFSSAPAEAWLALGWRQYLSWFGKGEFILSTTDPQPVVREWLKTAAKTQVCLMDEPRNDGSWIRSWRQSLARFQKEVA